MKLQTIDWYTFDACRRYESKEYGWRRTIVHGRWSRHFCFPFISDFRLRSTDCKRMLKVWYERHGTRCFGPFDRAAVCTEIRCRRRLLSTAQWLWAQFIHFAPIVSENNKISVYDRVKCIACSQECVPGYWQTAPRGFMHLLCGLAPHK